MFNGKVKFKGQIIDVSSILAADILQVSIAVDNIDYKLIKKGDIMLHNGCSLTISDIFDDYYQVLIYKETLLCTTGLDQIGNILNLEPALKVGDTLNGGFITGFIDGVAKVYDIISISDGCKTVIFELPPELNKYLIEKASIVINGVSLTVNKVYQNKLEVNLNPRTLSATTLGQLFTSMKVNIEINQIAKYVYQFINQMN